MFNIIMNSWVLRFGGLGYSILKRLIPPFNGRNQLSVITQSISALKSD
jgi:hypothetical protein